MKVLVTGGAGFIGSHLVERLIEEGHHVDVIDDLSSGSLANLAEARSGRTKRLTIDQIDIRDAAIVDLMQRRQPEVVFHLAVHDDGAGSVDRAVADAEVNIVGALNVFEGARRAGTRKVVFASSASIYEAPAPGDLPIREKHSVQPRSPHGVAKTAVVDYLSAYREIHDLEFAVLVLADVYGPRRRSGVVATFVDQVRAGEAPTVHGDGTQTRDFVFIDDVVDAFVRAAEKGSGLIANVSTGTETSIADLAGRIAAIAGRDVQPVLRPGRPGEPGRLSLDPGRARIHLGWSPWTTLDDGLRQVIAAHPG